ncbi:MULTISPECIES: flagellin [Citromicrobium]|uniref:flagellin n=1 Tax=Citromicrobium TaxID=72173 RepID=UPI0001DD0B3C|nr:MULTISPECIES: flagellin [Citromicrobium]ALG60254.1 flagellin [Citromicrobium sp. JL477]KPM18922.1 flagellin [Citromicrobium sp. JL1351]KPM20620.1 flagellin [Citromicrobium sp. JL31]KPM29910.1 flagellin [Citromicrobium sp. JL2201]MCD1623246.1 flagellin [Citromicrobium bathyomarinum]
MTRVATIPLQRTMADAIQRAQQNLAKTQTSLSTGKKAQDYAGLGTEAVRTMSARSMLAKQEAQAVVSKHVTTSLAIYDAHVTGLDNTLIDLRTRMATAIGTEDSSGLQETIKGAFEQFRSSLNAKEGGIPLFGGSRTDVLPFAPESLADVAATPASDAFRNDDVRAVAHLSEGTSVTYGITASDLGAEIYEAFRTLAAAGPIGERLTDAQKTALQDALVQIDTGSVGLRAANAENGRKQARVETLGERAEQRSLVLSDIIAANEDADLGQVAVDLAQQKATLEASYSVFAQLSQLNLTKYL